MMKPGRELDALVAEKVFGYEKRLVPKESLPNADTPSFRFPRQDSYLFVNKGGYPDFFMGHVNDMYVDSSRGWKETLPGVPHYSTSIADAWPVVEKIKFWQPNPDVFGLKPDHLQKFTVEYTGFGWRAGWAPISLDGNMTIEAEAETAEMAICLAALKAMEVSNGNV